MIRRALAIMIVSFSLMGLLGITNMASGENGNGPSQIVSVLGAGKVQGQDVVVDILVEVKQGQNANDVVQQVLRDLGLRPFDSANLGSEGFTVTGLVWNNLPVVQNYNPGSQFTEDEPFGAGTALTNTHTTWDGVTTSNFDINFGGITDRCPSLVRECDGSQFFDGNNDVAWLKLRPGILGVTWFSTSIDEADIVLSIRYNWNDGCNDVKRSFDAQTVFLHENGHVVGLGHSDDALSVMQPNYHGADCGLGDDDKEGATFLYDSNITGVVSGIVKDTDGVGIAQVTVSIGGTSLQATTLADGSYSISNIHDPVTYDITASIGDTSDAQRLEVNGATTVNFTLDISGGTEDDDSGGACPPAKAAKGKC